MANRKGVAQQSFCSQGHFNFFWNPFAPQTHHLSVIQDLQKN